MFRAKQALCLSARASSDMHWDRQKISVDIVEVRTIKPTTVMSMVLVLVLVLSNSLLSGAWAAATDEELPAPRFLLEWGRKGKGEGEFDACVGIAIGKNDVVYTAEFRNQRVQRFTSEGKFLGMFAVPPHAGGMAVDS